MTRLLEIVVATIVAGCACKYAPIDKPLTCLIAAVWFYLAMDFVTQNLYSKSLYKCFFDGEPTQYNR